MGCGPKTGKNNGLEIRRRAFSKHSIHDFDYDVSLKNIYAHDENPASLYYETSDESSEQDSEVTELMSGIDGSGDYNDDEWVASSSEDGDDNGLDTVVEPPKKEAEEWLPYL